MPELIAKSAFLPGARLEKAGLELAAIDPGPIWSIALYPGAADAAKAALAPLDLAFPGPGESREAQALRLVWSGREEALLFGGTPPAALQAVAALTDQSSAYAAMSLTGSTAPAALSRLTEPDLRLAAFPVGAVLRSSLHHVPLLLLRSGAERFELFVPRSMARSAWGLIAEVLDRMAARAAL